MTSRDFCYWLQGYLELEAERAGEKSPALGAEQVLSIKKHLTLVFRHEIDPSAGPPEHQAELNAIHDAKAEEALKKLQAEVDVLKARPTGGGWSGPQVLRC